MRELRINDHRRDFAGMTYVYPVLSRRAGGVSVGINLNPNNACNWACVYGQVPDLVRGAAPPIDIAVLESELSGFLEALTRGDYLAQHVPEGLRVVQDIAFSGNGEPTSAAGFDAIVARVAALRDAAGLQHVPIRVITNGSLMLREVVQRGVAHIAAAGGEVWFKVDAGTSEDIERINSVNLSPAAISNALRSCAALCPTWVQTCMFRWDGEAPTAAHIDHYLACLEAAGLDALQGVLLYGVARPSMQSAASRITPLSESELEQIAQRIREKGLTVKVSP